MKLTRLEHHHHPRPPHHELRQKGVFDSGVRPVGQVENLYVDDDMDLQFVDVAVSRMLGFGKKHYLLPVEAIGDEAPGSITLRVDQQTVESAPTLGDPHGAPDEDLQRTTREHYGYG